MIVEIIGGIGDSQLPEIEVSKYVVCENSNVIYGIIMKKDNNCIGYSHNYFIDIYDDISDAIEAYKVYQEKEIGLYQFPDDRYVNQYRQLVKLRPANLSIIKSPFSNKGKLGTTKFVIEKAYYSNRDSK